MGRLRHIRYHPRAWDELRKLNQAGYAALRAVIKSYERGEELDRHYKPLKGYGGKYHELRATSEGCEYRAIFRLDGNYSTVVWVLTAFDKKSSSTPIRHILRAQRRWVLWRGRGDGWSTVARRVDTEVPSFYRMHPIVSVYSPTRGGDPDVPAESQKRTC